MPKKYLSPYAYARKYGMNHMTVLNRISRGEMPHKVEKVIKYKFFVEDIPPKNYDRSK